MREVRKPNADEQIIARDIMKLIHNLDSQALTDWRPTARAC